MPFDAGAFGVALESDKLKKPQKWQFDRSLSGSGWDWFWDKLLVGFPIWERGGPVRAYGKRSDVTASLSATGATWGTNVRGTCIDLDGSDTAVGLQLSAPVQEQEIDLTASGEQFSVVSCMAATDWSPTGFEYIYGVRANAGASFWLPGGAQLGNLRFTLLGVADYTSTAANGITDGEVGVVGFTATIGTDVLFYSQGVQVGDAVTIATGTNNTEGIGDGLYCFADWGSDNRLETALDGEAYGWYMFKPGLTAAEHAMLSRDFFGPFRPDMAKLLPAMIKAPVAGGTWPHNPLGHPLIGGLGGPIG